MISSESLNKNSQLGFNLEKLVIALEHISFLFLGILAYTFTRERLLADSGYYFFQVVNSEWFWIEHNRIILALSQLPVVIGSWVGIGLKQLIIIYSIWHPLFFYGIYLVCRFRFNDLTAGPTLILLQTLGISLGFFVPMFELYYAAGLIVLFNAALANKINSWRGILLLITLAIFIASAHFSAIILLGAIVVMHLINNGSLQLKSLVLPSLAVVSVVIYKRFHISPYEQGKIDWFLNGLKNFTLNQEYVSNVASYLFTEYVDLLAVVILATAALIASRKWSSLVWFAVCLAALLIIATISSPWFGATRYEQQVYFPVGFFASMVMMSSCLGAGRKWFRPALVMTICILAVTTFEINQAASAFTERLDEIRANIRSSQTLSGTKFYVREADLKHEANWSYPLESLILSATEFEKTVTICTDVDLATEDNSAKLKPDQHLFRRWGELYPISELNQQYFLLDTSNYHWIKPGIEN